MSNYKNKNKSKGSKSRGKEDKAYVGKDKREEYDESYTQPQAEDNDISWWTKYPNLSIASSSLPYPYKPGMKFPLSRRSTSAIPGILALNWAPSIGVSTADPTNPINVLAKEMYAKVRNAYSGTLRADAPDYPIYLLALDSVFAYIAHLKRIYRILTKWSEQNFLVPDMILQAMGYKDTEIADLRENRMALYGYINELVLHSRKFSCPANMDILNRHSWMNNHVYVENPDQASQLYVFNMTHVYMYKETTIVGDAGNNKGPGLVYVAMPRKATSGNSFVKTLFNFGLSLITALVDWDEAYTIKGYLERAYSDVPQFIVEELGMNETLDLVYSDEVLLQIHNAQTLGGEIIGLNDPDDDSTPEAHNSGLIQQNVVKNALITHPKIFYDEYHYNMDSCLMSYEGKLPIVIDVQATNPTAADNIVATRLKVLPLSMDGIYNYALRSNDFQIGLYPDQKYMPQVNGLTGYMAGREVMCATELLSSIVVYGYFKAGNNVDGTEVTTTVTALPLGSWETFGVICPGDANPTANNSYTMWGRLYGLLNMTIEPAIRQTTRLGVQMGHDYLRGAMLSNMAMAPINIRTVTAGGSMDIQNQSGTRVPDLSGISRAQSWIEGDLYNVTIVQPIDFENINRVCLFSAFSSFSQV